MIDSDPRPRMRPGVRLAMLGLVGAALAISLTGCNELYDVINDGNYDGVDAVAEDLDLSSLGTVACDWHTQSGITGVAEYSVVIEGASYDELADRLRDAGYELSGEEDLTRSVAWEMSDRGPSGVNVFVFDEGRMIGDSAKGCRADGPGVYVAVREYLYDED